MEKGFKVNGKHTNDFGLILLERSISPPAKKKIKETVPFMNGSYDFSELYGEHCYDERTITYKFDVSDIANQRLEYKIFDLQSWLLSEGEVKLYDDDFIGTYFKAECIDVTGKTEDWFGEVTFKFTAYPFRFSENNEGSDIWDTFNFETDVAQEVKYIVSGSKEITLYNNGFIKAYPTIICDNNMQLIKDNITYNISSGVSKGYNFALKKGENKITINGTGSIEFIFKKEVI